MSEEKEKDLEIFENPDALAGAIDKSQDFVKKNQTVFIGALAGLAIIIAGVVFWNKSQEDSKLEAAQAVFKAEYYLSIDSLNLAKNGGDNFQGFEEIATNFSGTPSGELAKFYLGCIALKQGNHQEAADILSDYSNDVILVSARAYALAGDAYMELGDTESAISYYNKAAKHEPNAEYTPGYLIKLATAQEASQDYAGAVLSYEKIVADFPKCTEISKVKKWLARVQIIAAN